MRRERENQSFRFGMGANKVMQHLEPVMKWSGSKRSQAAEIVRRFPREIGTYYEPFCGGCSVLYRLLHTPSVKVSRFVCSDLNEDLIGFWNCLLCEPQALIDGYRRMWKELNADNDIERKKQYFSEVRDRLNVEHSSVDFLFIMRTCTNGMPRYNDAGKFNNSFHVTRPGINPNRMEKLILEWNADLSAVDISFHVRDYSENTPREGDFVYADPPYAATKGMYFGGIDMERYFAWLKSLPCKWGMSFDGKAGNEDMTYSVPQDLYAKHEYIASGNSSFRRVIGKDRHADVFESLYMNYKPQVEAVHHRQEELF